MAFKDKFENLFEHKSKEIDENKLSLREQAMKKAYENTEDEPCLLDQVEHALEMPGVEIGGLSHVAGAVFHDTATGETKMWTGTHWHTLGVPSSFEETSYEIPSVFDGIESNIMAYDNGVEQGRYTIPDISEVRIVTDNGVSAEVTFPTSSWEYHIIDELGKGIMFSLDQEITETALFNTFDDAMKVVDSE